MTYFNNNYTTCENLFCSKDKIINLENNGENFLFIGEAPGKTEDKYKKVFCGTSGKLFREIIEKSGIKNFSITNSVKCRPYNNTTPNINQILNCQKNLIIDLKIIKENSIIICVGKTSLKSLSLILSDSRINNLPRLQKIKIKFNDLNIILGHIPHPAYILYKGSPKTMINEVISFLSSLAKNYH